VGTPSFAQADLDTGLIEREQATLFPGPQAVPAEAWQLAALAELAHEPAAPNDAVTLRSPFQARDGWRLNHPGRRHIRLRLAEHQQDVQVTYLPAGYRLDMVLDGKSSSVQAQARFEGQGRLQAQLGERRVHATVVFAGERRVVFFDGRSYTITCVDPLQAGGDGDDAHGGLTAPMPGKVIAWSVQPGASVDKGAALLVLEAMKMEHTIVAPRAGVVKSFHFAPGEQVSEGVELVVFDAIAS
jgi:3-methylcrotonyl-CoA carboxylase alpha subunit